MGTHGKSASRVKSSRKSCHQTSRPRIICTLSSLLLTTITFCTLGHWPRMRSRLALRGFGLPPRITTSAVITIPRRADHPGPVPGDGDTWPTVLHAAFRIAGEDIGMHRAKAGAGQHGDDKFGNHGQVKGHAVALANAQSVQGGGHAADVVVEHLVGVGPDFHFPFALPDERGLVAVVGYDVPVNAVIGGIEPRAPEPFHARHGKIAVVDLFPGP